MYKAFQRQDAKLNARIFCIVASLVVLLVAAFLSSCSTQPSDSGNAHEKVPVVASFYPMADFAKKIGGDKVEVTTLVPSGIEPHDWEPSPADIEKLEKARVLIYNGLGMEYWVDDTLPALGNKNLVTCFAADGVSIIESNHAHEQAHEHESNGKEDSTKYGEVQDPHVWLNPLNAKVELSNIKDALVKADPDNASYYEENYKLYAQKCDELDTEYKSTLEGLARHEIIVSHDAYGYLSSAYGLETHPIEGLHADGDPSPQELAELASMVKKEGIKVIFAETLLDPKTVKTLSEETGAKVEVLNPLEGLSEEEIANGEDYFTVMQKNLESLKVALS